ncbi:DUF4382 domain-containing protein [Vibrio nereis]|uniref:DUF4382 domain-containing protein n=1 Tax=Vibrio nereis TaxID=693 RepID=A0A0M0HR44_VIBNE|nr:DUF4382 domain-containing protein [Vibrio nereis]KOO04524.1 hypothetical protein AKJ17_06360 [Vibrio nereis]
MDTLKFSLVGAAVALTLVGCGSDSDATSSSTTPVTLSVSDAPIDDVSEVVVNYSKVAFLPVGEGKPLVFEINKTNEEGKLVDESGTELADDADPLPLSVDLLNYQGSNAIELVKDQEIPTGSYKLCVFSNDGTHPTYPSYVVGTENGNQMPLTVKGEGKCPQGVGAEPNAGVLYFNDTFTVNADNNNYVVEFDLRRGLKEVTGENSYTLQRTSVSLINTVTTGDIKGNVALETYQNCELNSADSANGFAHAVYLYQGNIAQDAMGPFATLPDTQTPIAAANVNVTTGEEGDTYNYEFGFVEPGTYSVGYTCTANDDSEAGLVEGETFTVFKSVSDLSVVAGTQTSADINPSADLDTPL